MITKPQNVYVMRDVACSDYVAGCNTMFFAKTKDAAGAVTYDLNVAQTNMMKRLSFADDVGAKYASMLAFPCFEAQFESGHLDTVMSVTTRLCPWEVTSAMGGDHNSFPGGKNAYSAYSAALNLRSVHFGEDMKAAENQDFISQVCVYSLWLATPQCLTRFCRHCVQGSTNNATCFVGPSRRYDPFAKGFYSLTPGQGHWGPDAIPGVSIRIFKHSNVLQILTIGLLQG